MRNNAKVFLVISVSYIVIATICIMVIKRGISKAIDEEYKTLVENMRP